MRECIRSYCRSIHQVSECIWSNWRWIFKWGNVGNCHSLDEGMHSELQSFHSFITMTSQWAWWRLRSPASRLFTQPFIRAQIKENFKAPRHWPLCGEFTGTGEFPAQKASNAENVSIWWRHHVKKVNAFGVTMECMSPAIHLFKERLYWNYCRSISMWINAFG